MGPDVEVKVTALAAGPEFKRNAPRPSAGAAGEEVTTTQGVIVHTGVNALQGLSGIEVAPPAMLVIAPPLTTTRAFAAKFASASNKSVPVCVMKFEAICKLPPACAIRETRLVAGGAISALPNTAVLLAELFVQMISLPAITVVVFATPNSLVPIEANSLPLVVSKMSVAAATLTFPTLLIPAGMKLLLFAILIVPPQYTKVFEVDPMLGRVPIPAKPPAFKTKLPVTGIVILPCTATETSPMVGTPKNALDPMRK